MQRLALFATMCIAGGLGGAVGSMVGHAFGHRGLFVGGALGGVLAVFLAAALARRLHWIPRERFLATAIGASLGFILAAVVAAHTLSSPVGPILSTLLVGAGALLGQYASNSVRRIVGIRPDRVKSTSRDHRLH